MGNIFTKRTAVLFLVTAVGIGMLRKYAKNPDNKDSPVTKIVDSIGLSA